MTCTIADSLSPAELEALEQAFRLEAMEYRGETPAELEQDEIETLMGFVTSEYLWDAMWRFGIVLDDDKLERLGWSLRDDDQMLHSGYYVPDDYDTEYQLIELAGPGRADALHLETITITS